MFWKREYMCDIHSHMPFSYQDFLCNFGASKILMLFIWLFWWNWLCESKILFWPLKFKTFLLMMLSLNYFVWTCLNIFTTVSLITLIKSCRIVNSILTCLSVKDCHICNWTLKADFLYLDKIVRKSLINILLNRILWKRSIKNRNVREHR